jgi:hypothetical protein
MTRPYAQLGGRDGRPYLWERYTDASGRPWLVYPVTVNPSRGLSVQPIPVNYTAGVIFVDDARELPRRFAPTPRATYVIAGQIPDHFARSEPFRSGREVVACYAARGTPLLDCPRPRLP